MCIVYSILYKMLLSSYDTSHYACLDAKFSIAIYLWYSAYLLTSNMEWKGGCLSFAPLTHVNMCIAFLIMCSTELCNIYMYPISMTSRGPVMDHYQLWTIVLQYQLFKVHKHNLMLLEQTGTTWYPYTLFSYSQLHHVTDGGEFWYGVQGSSGIKVFLIVEQLSLLLFIKFSGLFKVAWNYSYVASTTAINNTAASQLPAIKLITR